MLNYEKYIASNQIGYVEKPKEPKLKSLSPSPKEVLTYENEINEYETKVTKWLNYKNKYRDIEKHLLNLFAIDLANKYIAPETQNLFPNTIENLFQIAYQKGHGSGFSEIENEFSDLIVILDKIKKDIVQRVM